MLYDKIRELPKLASYPHSSVLLLLAGGSSTLTGSASVSIRLYESTFTTVESGGTIGLSAAPALTAKAGTRRSIVAKTMQHRLRLPRPWEHRLPPCTISNPPRNAKRVISQTRYRRVDRVISPQR